MISVNSEVIFVDPEVIFVDSEVRACFHESVTWLIVTSEFVRRSRTQLITRGQYSVPVLNIASWH